MATKKPETHVQPTVEVGHETNDEVAEVAASEELSEATEGQVKPEELGKTEDQDESTTQDQPKISRYVVSVAFRDIDNFAKEHAVGETITGFEAGRLSSLLKLGYVELVEDPE